MIFFVSLEQFFLPFSIYFFSTILLTYMLETVPNLTDAVISKSLETLLACLDS